MNSQPIVQWSYISLYSRGFFNNVQGLFVLIVGCVYMTTHPLTKYDHIMERVCFIYRLFVLFISASSFLMFLYTVS